MAGAMQGYRTVPLYLTMIFAALAATAVVAGFWADRGARSSGPEAPVIAYSAALARGDLKGALDQLAPDARVSSAPFVDMQLKNRYTILESAVRSNSLLDRMLGRPVEKATVVVTMEVQEVESGTPPWRTTEELSVGIVNGRWYLLKPPLQQ